MVSWRGPKPKGRHSQNKKEVKKMKQRQSTSWLIDQFISELNQLPLDFPVAKWGERAVEKGSELYYNFGRKNTYEKYEREIQKAMQGHPQNTVHTEYAVNWVSGHIRNNAWQYDHYCRA